LRRDLALLALVLASAASACRQDMHDQPKFRGLRPNPFFSDGRSARPAIPDTVARGDLGEDDALASGKKDGVYVASLPVPLDRALLARGRERFDIYCSPCHSPLGDGRGMVVRRGFSPPPSFHIPRLREAPPGYFFDVISHGFGRMQDYSAQIAVTDRWAIVAYVRALQLSQDAPLSDVPAEERARLEQEAR
jgi:mono/diheme cytochrome c family protein